MSTKKVISIKTKQGKGILLSNPYISKKGFIQFKDISVSSIEAEYSFEKKILSLKVKNKEVIIKLSKSDREWLDVFYEEEFKKANDYFIKGLSGDIELIINDNFVDTKELIENGYNPYYIKIFEYFINKYFKTENLDIIKLNKIILERIDLNSYKLTNKDGWEYYSVPLTDIK